MKTCLKKFIRREINWKKLAVAHMMKSMNLGRKIKRGSSVRKTLIHRVSTKRKRIFNVRNNVTMRVLLKKTMII